MTDFLTINAMAVGIAHDQSGHKPGEIGFGERAYDGDWRDTRRAFRRSWGPLTTTSMNISDAEQLEHLLLGKGWHFDFESDMYACAKGLGPNTGYAGSSISGTQKKIGSYSLYITSASVGPTYDTNLTTATGDNNGDWTVMFWQYVAAWVHYAIVYDADTTTTTKYVNGAAGGTIHATYIAGLVSSGDVVLKGIDAADNSNDNCYYDDLVILPYKATSALVAAHYAANEFSDLPYVNMGGDIRKTTAQVACRCPADSISVKHTQCVLDGAWTDQARIVTFQLDAVDA